MATEYDLTLPLPRDFRANDILAFHRRDAQAISERVTASRLEKGLLWHEAPACLSLQFFPQHVQAHLAVDGVSHDDDVSSFNAMVQRMLGLTQDIDAFEARHADHPHLGKLIAEQPGLRVPLATTPFEALTWAITGQQISLGAAVSIRRRLIQASGLRHSSGLLCYPGAQQILALPPEGLRQAGFSTSKASSLQAVARLVLEETLPLDAWASAFPGAERMREQLMAVRGIGPWTINYTLLRGFGWLDGSLHGDAAVRRGLQMLLGTPGQVSEKEAQAWLAPFSPWRALIGAHIWAMQAMNSAGGQ